MSDAFTILAVGGTLVEELETNNAPLVHKLSSFRIERLITLHVLSHGRYSVHLQKKKGFTLESGPVSF
jgi:hypothetical protein